MVDNLILVLLSFALSTVLGIVFGIRGKDLALAGTGGALTRIVVIALQQVISQRLLYTMLAALAAAIYGEALARKKKYPSTYFIYPSILPLIPGDLFYYSITSLMQGDTAGFTSNSVNCILTLLGMSLGFVLSSTVVHYAISTENRLKRITKRR